MPLHGYTPPLTASGRASLVRAPAWHYAGDLIVLEYAAPETAAAAVLPDELEVDHSAEVSVAAVFANWQCTSDDTDDLVDPSRTQHNEFFMLLAVRERGQPAAYCPFIWVDSDVSMLRGWLQGFPKEFGTVRLTRSLPDLGRAAAPLGAGTVFGATCGARDAGVAAASARLEGEGGWPLVYGRRLILRRHFADAAGGEPLVNDLVEVVVEDARRGPAWHGPGTLRLDKTAGAEFAALAPTGAVAAHRLTVGYTVTGVRPIQTATT